MSLYDEKDEPISVTLQEEESIFPFLNLIEEDRNLQIEIANLLINRVDNYTPHPLNLVFLYML